MTNTVDSESIAALEAFERLAGAASGLWFARRAGDVERAGEVHTQVALWLCASSPEMLGRFLALVSGYMAAGEQLIAERVEGTLPGEYHDAVMTLLRTRVTAGSP